MKKRDKAAIVDAFQYMKYAQITSLISTFLPVLIIPLLLLSIISFQATAILGFALGLFYLIMALTTVMFTHSGLKGLRKSKAYPYPKRSKRAYTILIIYLILLIGGYIFEKSSEDLLLIELKKLAVRTLLLVVFFQIAVLMQGTVEKERPALLKSIKLISLIAIGLNIFFFISSQFVITSAFYFVAGSLTIPFIDFLNVPLSILLIVGINTFVRVLKTADYDKEKSTIG